MNVFSLFASLTLDKSDYDKNLKSAQQEGEQFAENTEKKVSPKVVAGWLAIVAAILKAVQAVKKLATETMNYADNIGDLAAQYGVSTDAISEMQYIADQSSTSIEGLTSSMTMLYTRAKQDGEAFKQLGVSVKNANGDFKSMDELFWETVGALNNVKNEGEKSAIMLDLFGRSAMSVGEVLRKDSEEIARMRKEAHQLGVVVSEDTIKFASDFNDTIAVVKLQGKSAIASLVAGAPDAEERLQVFLNNVTRIFEEYTPTFVSFAVRLLTQTVIALVKIAPSLAVQIIDAFQETILNIDWIEFGFEIGKKILEGLINSFLGMSLGFLKLFGIDVPQVDFSGEGATTLSESVLGENYEISENVKQDINVRIEANGDTAVSKESAEKTAKALAPYIDKILGGK